MKYIDTMILDIDKIQGEARKLQKQQRIGELHGTFDAAWRAFHGSFDADEDKVVAEMVAGAKQCVEVVSLPNLNVMVWLLKDLGRDDEARDLLKFYASNFDDPTYWTSDDPFGRGPFDPDVSDAIEQKRPQATPVFDPAAALIKAGKDYDAQRSNNSRPCRSKSIMI
jgi:hypothetical protein